LKRLSLILLFAIFDLLFCSCSSTADKKDDDEKTFKSSPSYNRTNTNDQDENDEVSSSCKIEDGTYSATVDYNNPETGYSNTYTLDVDVESCQVVQINFPKGGWLDEDHIDAADIDEDGNASVSGENDKTYEVHIDN
jgi:hypothetical protein